MRQKVETVYENTPLMVKKYYQMFDVVFNSSKFLEKEMNVDHVGQDEETGHGG